MGVDPPVGLHTANETILEEGGQQRFADIRPVHLRIDDRGRLGRQRQRCTIVQELFHEIEHAPQP